MTLTAKQKTYAEQKIRLRRARAGGFFYEAILIEYAMMEDRTESLLRHAGIKTVNNNGNPFMISEKLRKIEGNPKFHDPFIRKRLNVELIERVRKWKKDRDDLTHGLMKHLPDYEKAKQVADEGAEIVRLFENKTRSVNDWRERNKRGE